jgi:anti-sigma-K factor RskA
VPHSELTSEQHLDEETVSLLALGEQAGHAAGQHLAACEYCGAELASLRAVVSAAREPAEIMPPSRVWEGIAAATGVRIAPRDILADPASAAPVELAVDRPLDRPVSAPAPVSPRQPRSTRPRWTRPRSTRPGVPGGRRPRLRVLTATLAAAALVVGVAIGVGVSRLDSSTREQVVAETRLGGLRPAPDASGRADVVKTRSGRELDVDVSDLARPDGFYQVWLIDRSVTKMVPVGVLNGDVGHWSLPDDMNLADYPLVDVSLEPLDGDPAHSGKSVLRGTLPI